MECVIQGRRFKLITDVLEHEIYRNQYFSLAQKIFRLNFNSWYDSGYCDRHFIPYTLCDGEIVVASVGVVTGEFKWQNNLKIYVQVSTVMTLPEYRGMGLCRWLMELVLHEWRAKSDIVYLYANDTVLDFYPKFGFKKVDEYSFSLPIEKQPGVFRKLDMKQSDDITLLAERYKSVNNPYSGLTAENNISMVMFHSITFLSDNIYYIEELNAVVIAEFDQETMFCYDIYADGSVDLKDIIGVIVDEKIMEVKFGFTPDKKYDCCCEKSQEKNTTVFVLGTECDLFSRNKITIPYMSRA